MTKPANKPLIGVFVVGAILLLIAAVLILGSGKFFRNTFKTVMFFDGSIKGLNVGSPVMFRGVKIGTVTDINLIMNADDLSLQTPVVAEFDPERWTLIGGERDAQDRLKRLIDRGLRAQLQMQSFVTGQLIIQLDFFPDKPAAFVGLVKQYIEIPTVPTSLEELSRTLQDLPLQDIVRKLDLVVGGIHDIISSPDAKESIRNLNIALQDTRKLVRHIDEQIDPMVSSLNVTASTAHDSLELAKDTMTELRGDAKEIVMSTKETLDAATSALTQVEKTLKTVSADSPLVYELHKTLRDLSLAARSTRLLTDYLERHPEALLKGKSEEKGASQ